MSLPAESRDAIGTHIMPKLESKGCSVCGNKENDKWIANETLTLIAGQPYVIIHCQICGHAVFFNAINTQVVKTSSGEPETA